jgi:hypothetical protein
MTGVFSAAATKTYDDLDKTPGYFDLSLSEKLAERPVVDQDNALPVPEGIKRLACAAQRWMFEPAHLDRKPLYAERFVVPKLDPRHRIWRSAKSEPKQQVRKSTLVHGE